MHAQFYILKMSPMNRNLYTFYLYVVIHILNKKFHFIHTILLLLQIKNNIMAVSFVLCKEVVLFGRFKRYWNYRLRGNIFGPVKLCHSCREIVCVSEQPFCQTFHCMYIIPVIIQFAIYSVYFYSTKYIQYVHKEVYLTRI